MSPRAYAQEPLTPISESSGQDTMFPSNLSSSRPYRDAPSPFPSAHQSERRLVLDPEDDDEDMPFDPFAHDSAYRLRTTRTAHSVIAESIRSETAADNRRKAKRIFSNLRRKATMNTKRSRRDTASSETTESSPRLSSGPSEPDPVVPPPSALGRRTVFVNVPLPSALLDQKGEPLVRYVRNKVRTSKYTILTFLPKNLFEQFRRVANIYFLALVVLQVFPIFGATNAQIGMLPLIFILAMTAIKDAIEDWRRATLDNEVNNSATTKLEGWRNVNQPLDPRTWWERLLRTGPDPEKPSKGVRKLRAKEAQAGQEALASPSTPNLISNDDHSVHGSTDILDRTPSSGNAQWERTLWKKLQVGDLVMLKENEQIPADIVVLSTSSPDTMCFVETKNLDGETNLKPRKALKATASIQSEEELERARFVVDSEAPHANLYSYNGVLQYTPVSEKPQPPRQEAITINELLLRGCTLRNTRWIIGLVVFTGADTKIMLNGGDTPSKRSKIEKETNFNVVMNFVILLVLCFLTAILHGYYRSIPNQSADWYEIDAQNAENIYLDSVIIFFSSLIVFQNIVPISLYITIEIVKTIQAYFIFQDIEMYYDVYDTPCVPKSWNISDDLGQIEYVFSDKTGTLTQNIMEFKQCSVQGVTFGEVITEAQIGAAMREGRDLDTLGSTIGQMLDTMRKIPNRYLREDKLTFVAPDMPRRLQDKSDPLRPHIITFFRALALCHTVLADAPDASKPFELDYKAESPDEAALVSAARDVGFAFVSRNNTQVQVEILGERETWTPLRVLEFNSTRKRMSVIMRSPEGRYVLFCKGADSVIYERLSSTHDQSLKSATLKDLETFANSGLRTLCIAQRELGEAEFKEWAQQYDSACAAVHDRETAIDAACELIERELTILGATALEDKLQEGVPDAIATLQKAGIKLWVLTGDKLQTAIEIGYSCNLLTNTMEVMIISTDSEEGARVQIEAGLNKMSTMQAQENKTAFAVVIDGESLRYALQPSLKTLFLSLGTQCVTVICCRVSPSQKALTVKLVKEGCNAMTLAIGDGANDVAMIQEANVGVGLYGLEGGQAAMSADYAFGQFRFLTRLLLVHGRWSYVRIADMHANFFYKNIIWTLALFWFLLFNSFDATYLFQYTFMLLYNLVFTSLPVGILGASDQDTNATASLAFPQLYKRGIQGLDYTRTRFWLYVIDGIYQSAVIFFVPYGVMVYGATWSPSGCDTNGLYDLGTTVAAAGVLAANLYIGVNTRYWTFVTWVVIVVSTLTLYLWIPIYSYLADLSFYAEVSVLYTNFPFWATVVFTVLVAIGPHWLIESFKQSYMPKDKDIIREAWVAGDLKDQLGIAHRKRRADPERGRTTIVEDLINPLSAVKSWTNEPDEQYAYELADTSSPRPGRSPAPQPSMTPFESPSSGQVSPTQFVHTPSPLRIPEDRPVDFSTPVSGIDYFSPSGLDDIHTTPVVHETPYSLAEREIKRLSTASARVKRASLDADKLPDSPPSQYTRRSLSQRISSRPSVRRAVSGDHPGATSPVDGRRGSLPLRVAAVRVSPPAPARPDIDNDEIYEMMTTGSNRI